MEFAAQHLRQRDGVSCGPAVAVVAGTILDPGYRARLAATGRVGIEREQGLVHRAVNRIWPQRLGVTPAGMARALGVHGARRGVRYRWRPCPARHLREVERAVMAHWPVAMLIGNAIPRHWLLIIAVSDGMWHCYEPSSGELRSVTRAAVGGSRLTGLGFPRPFAVVLPSNI